ncbi:hypothetical protein PMAYCL1PPCAC_28368, partial [Pristionchus mayeri]
ATTRTTCAIDRNSSITARKQEAGRIAISWPSLTMAPVIAAAACGTRTRPMASGCGCRNSSVKMESGNSHAGAMSGCLSLLRLKSA